VFDMSSDTVLLAALGVLYLIDNSHRVPHGAFRFAFAPGAGWTVSRSSTGGTAPMSVAFPLPVLHWSFTVPAAAGGSLRPEAFWGRYRDLRPTARLLCLLSSASIALLFIGFPTGKAAFTTVGATTALVLSLAASSAVAVIAYRALRRLGCGRREAFRLARGLVWPIEAPSAPARVVGRAAEGFHPLVVARALLPDPTFHVLARPLAYDDYHHIGPDAGPSPGKSGWDCLLYPRTFPAALAFPNTTVAAPARAYCPRCGTEYRQATGACADCGVGLAGAVDAASESRDPRVAGT